MNKFPVLFSLALLLLLPNGAAFAKAVAIAEELEVTVENNSRAYQNANSLTASSSARIRIGGDADRSATGTAQKSRDIASTGNGKGEDIAQEHRSAVASFVQSLLQAVDRDGGIGAEVRAVAESQNDSASTTAEAMQKVEKRNSLKSFLFGTDWKNIGTLRREIARSENDVTRLEASIAEASDASVKADLETQLAALKAEQVKVQAFVDAEANRFSLLGWFTKMFVNARSQ